MPGPAELNVLIFVPGQGWSGSCVRQLVGWGLEVHKTRHAVSIASRKHEQKAVYILPNMAFRKRSLLTGNKLQQRWDGKDRGLLWVSKPASLEHPLLLLNSERKKKPISPDNWKAEWRWYHHCIETAQKTEWNICVYGWTRFFLRPTVKSSFSCPWAVWLWPRYIVSLSLSSHIGNSVNLIRPLWCYHQTLPIPCLLLTRCPSLSNSFQIT